MNLPSSFLGEILRENQNTFKKNSGGGKKGGHAAAAAAAELPPPPPFFLRARRRTFGAPIGRPSLTKRKSRSKP
jgi:hypothetical protein